MAARWQPGLSGPSGLPDQVEWAAHRDRGDRGSAEAGRRCARCHCDGAKNRGWCFSAGGICGAWECGEPACSGGVSVTAACVHGACCGGGAGRVAVELVREGGSEEAARS